MPTDQAIEVIYDEFELAVLQAHLDMYRSLPEFTSLTCFSLIHRGDREEACWRLKKRGMMNVTRDDGEDDHRKQRRLPGVEGQLTAKASDEMVRLFKTGILKKNDC